jgi:hypothetical protein
MALAWVAYGATYNFYFNNTEQGPNSTATPHVTVTDGNLTGAESKTMMGPKKPESEEDKEEVPAPAPAAAAAPAPAPAAAASSVAVAPAVEPEGPHPVSHLRLLVGGGFVAPKETVNYPGYSDPFGNSSGAYSYRSHQIHPGAKFELGFFGTRDVGLNFFGGGYSDSYDRPHGFGGAELEIQPVHVSIGKAYDLINFGIMVGATTLGRVDDNWVAAHAGARLQFNIGDGWGFAATTRANLGFYAADGSLVIRL